MASRRPLAMAVVLVSWVMSLGACGPSSGPETEGGSAVGTEAAVAACGTGLYCGWNAIPGSTNCMSGSYSVYCCPSGQIIQNNACVTPGTIPACGSGLYCSGSPIPGATNCMSGSYSIYCCPSGQIIQNNACASPSSSPIPLPVTYMHQYLGQASQNVDCGPTAVAMVVQYRNRRPANLTDSAFVVQARRNGGVADDVSDTTFGNLEASLSSYGLTWSEVPASMTPQPDAQFQAMVNATRAGKPVIALVHGATLGRGTAYGDHWVVVTGVSTDNLTVYLDDPDDQGARWAGWIVGGRITLDAATFKSALYNAAPGPYGIIVN